MTNAAEGQFAANPICRLVSYRAVSSAGKDPVPCAESGANCIAVVFVLRGSKRADVTPQVRLENGQAFLDVALLLRVRSFRSELAL